jgi:hypothetical protein
MLTDENAFGLLVTFYDIENAEYSLEPETFIERFTEFRNQALAYATESPLADATRVLDLGHALYFELADGDQQRNPIEWLKGLAAVLRAHDFEVALVLSHGGRWIDTAEVEQTRADTLREEALPGGYRLLHVTRPSEPLRRALYAETAVHGIDAGNGWGPGLYLDTEAVEALGKSPKNAPTPLSAGGATFYRIGK